MSKNLKTIFILSLIGLLFSGYLSFTKLVLGECPLTEGCPTFLGYPACYFGFILFLILFILSISALVNLNKTKLKLLLYISLLSIIFAAYSTIKEYVSPSCLNGICDYSLLLPTCVYGLAMYIIIFILSLITLKEIN